LARVPFAAGVVAVGRRVPKITSPNLRWEGVMAKFLVQAAYTADGLRGLQKEKASGRQNAVRRTVEALGGKVESMYFSPGDYDAVLILDLPDMVTGTALAIAVSASGLVKTHTTPLLSVEEVDRALSMSVEYRPPRG
jgi:uncharacterized protein with GYD domain